jgi:hypothetical protein
MENNFTPRVTRLTVARLYNLGRYEHKRYEICVEVPEGADATAAFRELNNILWDLRPIQVYNYNYRRYRALVAKADTGQELDDHEKEELEFAREYVGEIEAGKARITAAAERLKSLGGTEVHKDAKDDWDIEDY